MDSGSDLQDTLLRTNPAKAPHVGRWTTVFALFCLTTVCQANTFILAFLFAVPSSKGSRASIRDALDLTETDFGLLSSYIGIVPRLAAIIMTGRLSAKRPALKRQVTAASGFIMLIGLGLYSLARNYGQLAVAIVIVNIGVGVNTPMNAILVRTSTRPATIHLIAKGETPS